MDIYHLKDLNDRTSKYQGLSIKPEVGTLIRITRNPNNRVLLYQPKILNNLSIDRVYEVFKVINVYEVYIKNDKNLTSRLTKSLYQVVKEVTDKDIKEFTEMKKVLQSFDKVLKK